ncbi:multiubiquitin domain-containing protein [Naasia aerilata]|uniref:Multi-ubiquitin domain-containing protein n=1 Tax=Naasia aerilata TaxID=1162966 RepID=A0ABM8GB78_9MICO|nr:multiubiquitin domain-containing protein [Naasia aerilata]BDZ45474.1 hypothetical protein GCM10025866_13830 [Naasia aerilata]
MLRTGGTVTSAKERKSIAMPEQEKEHGKATTIYVNTREFEWSEKMISFEQVYGLAFPTEPLNDGDVVRIEFARGRTEAVPGPSSPARR